MPRAAQIPLVQIHRHWARESADVPAGKRPGARLHRWGWSDESLEEAHRRAREALAALVRRWQRGEALERYAYADRPLREELLERIEGDGPDPVGAITRNGYGALVLNTTRLMFIDIDDRPAEWGPLLGLFRRRKRSGWEDLGPIREVVARRPDLHLRVYRTCKGLRCIVTSEFHDPTSPSAREVLEAFGADPLYVRLCVAQECFRARLTPKPWRCGLRNPPARFPRLDDAREAAHAAWLREYEARIAGYATCRFLEEVGSGRVRHGVERLVALHDRHVRTGADLPLA